MIVALSSILLASAIAAKYRTIVGELYLIMKMHLRMVATRGGKKGRNHQNYSLIKEHAERLVEHSIFLTECEVYSVQFLL